MEDNSDGELFGAVIGNDDRFPVPNPTVEPQRFICRIEAVTSIEGSQYKYDMGTGFLILPNVIVTAAHNVWQPGSNYIQYNVGAAAYKPSDLSKMKQFKFDPRIVRIHPEFLKAKNKKDMESANFRNWDIAVITLPRNLAFSELRGNMFSYGEIVGGVPDSRMAVIGYPKKTPLKMTGSYGRVTGRGKEVGTNKPNNLLLHDIDAEVGQSGGPILPVRSDGVYGNACYGIHIAEAADKKVNIGLAFSKPIMTFIEQNSVIPDID